MVYTSMPHLNTSILRQFIHSATRPPTMTIDSNVTTNTTPSWQNTQLNITVAITYIYERPGISRSCKHSQKYRRMPPIHRRYFHEHLVSCKRRTRRFDSIPSLNQKFSSFGFPLADGLSWGHARDWLCGGLGRYVGDAERDAKTGKGTWER